MDTLKIDLQLIRKSVLRSQLLALESQAQAIYYLTTEHQDGVDLGRNPLIYLIVQQVKDVAATAKVIVEEAKTIEHDAMIGRLQALQTLATATVQRAEDVVRQGHLDADRRLEKSVTENLNPGESTTELPQLPADAKHLQAGADIACHRVEIDQHDTFKLQVRAICDLALELTFTAAVEAGHQYPSDKNYWQLG
ncbi:MAG: hypothetical protein JSS83_29210 [Cyanobacteria bacterium SZAS LIN-3]|nr:hypothetical protein [Cyanobacteria bacterium SZAS LIN-3]